MTACVAALALAACTEDVQLVHDRDAGERGSNAPAARPITRAQFCAGARLVSSSDAGASECGTAAGDVFGYALCSCGDATFTNPFATDAFDSTLATYAPGQSGASAGSDGNFVSTGPVSIAGSLIASGRGQLPIVAGPFVVAGNVETRADVAITTSDVSVGQDAWIDGDLLSVGEGTRVLGDLIQTPGHAAVGDVMVSGNTEQRAFSVEKPCACDAGETIDVLAAVAEAKLHADNDAAGLSRDALYADRDGALELACGRYVFDGGTISGARALVAHERTALFIDGDLEIAGTFAPDLGEDGELDVFVSGNFGLGADAVVGSPARPGALRIYVGGSGAILVNASVSFAANLYAPHASLFVTSSLTVYGALFVGACYATAELTIHYDRAVRTGTVMPPKTTVIAPPRSAGEMPQNTARTCVVLTAAPGDSKSH